MIRFFWFLIILFASIWVGLKIAEDPGYTLFAYKNWTVEMPLWFTIVAFVVLVFLLYGILRIFDKIDFSIYRWKNWLRWRKKYKSYSKTNRGLIELVEGHWRAAENYLLEGVKQSDAPLVNYLAAAKAAHEQGLFDKRDAYLRKAHEYAPQAETAIGLTQAQLQVEQGKLEQAAATLNHVKALVPQHPYVLKLLEKVYVRLGDWQNLLKLLPALRKANVINDEQLKKFEENIYQQLLNNSASKLETLRLAWNNIPKKYQKDPLLIEAYAKLLLPYPEAANEVETLICTALKKNWNKELVKLYGCISASDPKKQLVQAEKWSNQYGQQAVLLQALGRICMRSQLWGQARHFFEESLKLEANREIYLEYGKLLEEMGEPALAMQIYRKGLSI